MSDALIHWLRSQLALTINDSTISGNTANGGAPLGGGIDNNAGSVTINNSTISGNTASSGLGGHGGGISNYGDLTINNSTISANSAGAGSPSQGGGIYSRHGIVTIHKRTVVRNVAEGLQNSPSQGGGIFNDQPSQLLINSSTISGNSASGSGSQGGGIYNNGGDAELRNSIIANSRLGGDCSGILTSKGYNLSSDGTCNFNGTGDLNNTDPKLGKLGDHGGPTQTIPLLTGSPGIDSGNPRGCRDEKGHLLRTDQRGKPRPDKEDTGGCDRGAYERQKD